ncbi:hypothetical protein MPSI1_002178 [Malassezia psittaci]|uniref:Uncharacterized protein n=1 Tax=Malassezia psittaci TaxID=1821823 RepID=A0AAF0JKQ0_9BASI|nr:hypothetical protein MPSI1_002178 [Malassezia psittaci]
MPLTYGEYDYGTAYARSRDAIKYPISGGGSARPTGAAGTGDNSKTICVTSRLDCYGDHSGQYADTGIIAFACVWAIFSLVFLYQVIRRRAKLEYGTMLLFSILGYDEYQNPMLIVYTVAMVVQFAFVYLLCVQWTRLANACSSHTSFGISIEHPLMIAFLSLAAAAIIAIAGWGRYWYCWIVFLAFSLAIWIAFVIALIVHRRISPKENMVAVHQADTKHAKHSEDISHQYLNKVGLYLTQTILVILALASLMVIKGAFLIVVGSSWQTGEILDITVEFFQVFCILPDLAFTIIAATMPTRRILESSQYAPAPSTDTDIESNGQSSGKSS